MDRPPRAQVEPDADADGAAVEQRDTRVAILDSARELFVRHGYAGASIREVTAALDITPAALYYHFESKEAVLSGLLQSVVDGGEELLAKLRHLRADRPSLAPEHMAEAMGDYYDLLAGEVSVLRMVFSDPSIQESPPGEVLRAQARELFALLCGSDSTVADRLRATAAVGVVRLSLERREVDPQLHRDVIIRRALMVMLDTE